MQMKKWKNGGMCIRLANQNRKEKEQKQTEAMTTRERKGN